MDLCRYPLDLILVPFSLCLTAGYHAFLWHKSKTKFPATNVAACITRRKAWLQNIMKEKNEKKGMLAVQSFRNSLMSAILSASIAIIINTALAALANNTYKSSHLLRPAIFGSQAGPTLALKYASASILLLSSFLCSSMAVGSMIEANFLINALDEFFQPHTQKIMKRAHVLAIVGNRVLFVTVSFMLWFFGPIPLALASVASVWVFYNLDFSCSGFHKPQYRISD